VVGSPGSDSVVIQKNGQVLFTIDFGGGGMKLVAAGDLVIEAGGSISMKAGSNMSISTGGAMVVTAGAAMAVTVGGAQTISVGGSQTIAVGGSQSQTIGRDAQFRATGTYSILAGGRMGVSAGSAFDLTSKKIVSSSTVDTTIQAGGHILLKADKDVTLKGQNIKEN
jgi:type VI secretion system secreted protein VgrG